jgi:hypothetical protein
VSVRRVTRNSQRFLRDGIKLPDATLHQQVLSVRRKIANWLFHETEKWPTFGEEMAKEVA